MSLAYNQSYAILDGNVKRVLARFHQVSRSGSETKYESSLWNLANKHLPNKENDKYTQAVMILVQPYAKDPNRIATSVH